MRQLSLTEFKSHIEIEGFLYLPEEYQKKGYRLKVDEKNRIFMGRDVDDAAGRMPTLELMQMYESCGRQFGGIRCGQMISAYVQEYRDAEKADKKEKAYLLNLLDEFPEKEILYKFYPAEKNQKFYSTYPGRIRGKVLMLYMLCISGKEDEMKYCLITNEMLEHWGRREEDLFRAAADNMPKRYPYELTKKELLSGDWLYFITEPMGCRGFETVLYENGPLKEICVLEKREELELFPLSANTAVAFSESMLADIREVLKTAGDVFPYGEDILYYNHKLNEVAFDRSERNEQQEMLCGSIMDAAERRNNIEVIRR